MWDEFILVNKQSLWTSALTAVLTIECGVSEHAVLLGHLSVKHTEGYNKGGNEVVLETLWSVY